MTAIAGQLLLFGLLSLSGCSAVYWKGDACSFVELPLSVLCLVIYLAFFFIFLFFSSPAFFFALPTRPWGEDIPPMAGTCRPFCRRISNIAGLAPYTHPPGAFSGDLARWAGRRPIFGYTNVDGGIERVFPRVAKVVCDGYCRQAL